MIDLVLKKTITIKGPVSKVWEAITTSEPYSIYFMGTKVISDWKVGKPILFIGTWQGKDYTDKGTILKLENEKTFQYNYWSGFSGLADIPENYMLITFQLKPLGSETELTLTQENFNNEEQYKHSGPGWDGVLKAMKEMLEK
jgi:uncharacterized protein YndB with AHSA1/START domain